MLSAVDLVVDGDSGVVTRDGADEVAVRAAGALVVPGADVAPDAGGVADADGANTLGRAGIGPAGSTGMSDVVAGAGAGTAAGFGAAAAAGVIGCEGVWGAAGFSAMGRAVRAAGAAGFPVRASGADVAGVGDVVAVSFCGSTGSVLAAIGEGSEAAGFTTTTGVFDVDAAVEPAGTADAGPAEVACAETAVSGTPATLLEAAGAPPPVGLIASGSVGPAGFVVVMGTTGATDRTDELAAAGVTGPPRRISGDVAP